MSKTPKAVDTATDPYASFRTDKKKEASVGVCLDYGAFRVTIARAGGRNLAFAKAYERKMRPHRRQLATGTLADVVADKLMHELYAESIILDWEHLEGDTWKQGVIDPETRELLPPVAGSYARVFQCLPDIFQDIREQASNAANFRAEQLETEAGN